MMLSRKKKKSQFVTAQGIRKEGERMGAISCKFKELRIFVVIIVNLCTTNNGKSSKCLKQWSDMIQFSPLKKSMVAYAHCRRARSWVSLPPHY